MRFFSKTMNDNMSRVYMTEMNFLTRKTIQALEFLIFLLVKTAVKFKTLEITKTFNTDTNRLFRISMKVVYISLRYTYVET